MFSFSDCIINQKDNNALLKILQKDNLSFKMLEKMRHNSVLSPFSKNLQGDIDEPPPQPSTLRLFSAFKSILKNKKK